MIVQQFGTELDYLRNLYADQKPQRVLEIGVLDGGTLREWLLGAPDLVVAVDDKHRNEQMYDEWVQPGTELVLGHGRSQEPKMVALVKEHAPYDWVFIDGDHDEAAVRKDVRTCLPCTRGLLLMHDVVPGEGLPTTGPGVVLAELRRAGHEVDVYSSDPGEWPWAHGVGVVRL